MSGTSYIEFGVESINRPMPKALITGCTGQDGSYLTEFLLAKGYEVHGLKRRASSLNTDRLDHIYQDLHEAGSRFFLHYADLTDGSSLASLLYDIRPDEIYNLGAQSHVKVSFEVPEFTADVVALGTLRVLEAMRRTGVTCRFIRHHRARCSAARRLRRARLRPSTPAAPTLAPRSSATTSR